MVGGETSTSHSSQVQTYLLKLLSFFLKLIDTSSASKSLNFPRKQLNSLVRNICSSAGPGVVSQWPTVCTCCSEGSSHYNTNMNLIPVLKKVFAAGTLHLQFLFVRIAQLKDVITIM